MRSITGRLGAVGTVLVLGLFGSTIAGVAQEPTATDLVDALNGLFGKHTGARAAHTKGICLTGKFAPSAEAPKLSKAAHFDWVPALAQALFVGVAVLRDQRCDRPRNGNTRTAHRIRNGF